MAAADATLAVVVVVVVASNANFVVVPALDMLSSADFDTHFLFNRNFSLASAALLSLS